MRNFHFISPHILTNAPWSISTTIRHRQVHRWLVLEGGYTQDVWDWGGYIRESLPHTQPSHLLMLLL